MFWGRTRREGGRERRSISAGSRNRPRAYRYRSCSCGVGAAWPSPGSARSPPRCRSVPAPSPRRRQAWVHLLARRPPLRIRARPPRLGSAPKTPRPWSKAPRRARVRSGSPAPPPSPSRSSAGATSRRTKSAGLRAPLPPRTDRTTRAPAAAPARPRDRPRRRTADERTTAPPRPRPRRPTVVHEPRTAPAARVLPGGQAVRRVIVVRPGRSCARGRWPRPLGRAGSSATPCGPTRTRSVRRRRACRRTRSGTSQVVGSSGAVGRNRCCSNRTPSSALETDDRRVAPLADPRVHDPSHRLTGRRLERIPQVVRLGVPELVRGEVAADAVTERVGAELLLQHAEDARRPSGT